MVEVRGGASVHVKYTRVSEIVGDLLTIQVPFESDSAESAFRGVCGYGELGVVEPEGDGGSCLAQVIELDRDRVRLQVFGGTQGLTTGCRVRFLGHPARVAFSSNVLGRVFRGTGEPFDVGPSLDHDPQVEIQSTTVNPMRRVLASRMIRTDIPMIDLFNCLVESQKIPIFSIAGEPHNALLARIGIQADADVVIFGGLGLIHDDYLEFRAAFEEAGVFGRTTMFVNLASDPIVERLLVPDMTLALAERFAVEHGKRVLVLLTDMTAFADTLKEVAISMENVPANRGYPGDLYSQLARRYERACDYRGAGSVTILSVTTMPGNDVTHPIPDNTGYITEGQFYLHDGVLDPFGSLSRLKQHVIGKETREDHGQVMNAMIRFYAGSQEAEQKRAMAFELTPFDEKLLRFGRSFRERFMDIAVSIPLEDALDLAWRTLAECFDPSEVLIKQSILEKYFPKPGVDITEAASA